MSEYLIDYSDWFDEGGYCQVYPIKDNPGWVFKEFKNKKRAQESYKHHKILAKFDLAPQIYSKVTRLKFAEDDGWKLEEPSDWGYITECAKVYEANTKVSMTSIQNLVDDIYTKTGLKFWDCHWYNVGVVYRENTAKLVCIDTGKESFTSNANAWGMATPGPKCCYCNKYQCTCSED